MDRFCYISKILPNKSDLVREKWKNQPPKDEPKIQDEFWNHLGMTGFESWLQKTSQDDYMIHCLEGKSLQLIFKGLRELIEKENPVALKLQKFYLNVLGKDYASPSSEPHIEKLFDISLPASEKFIKRGFFFPLLASKEKEHRQFRKESMGPKKKRHEDSMQAFGVSHLSTWLQNTQEGKYIVVYTERDVDTPTTPASRLNQAKDSSAWQEIASILCDHTGLMLDELSPNSEWLTK